MSSPASLTNSAYSGATDVFYCEVDSMNSEQLLNRLVSFFEIHQSHYEASTALETDVDLDSSDFAAREEEARQEKTRLDGEDGEYLLTSDTAVVMEELEYHLDVAASEPLHDDDSGNELDEAAAERLLHEVMASVRELKNELKFALFWGTGTGDTSKFNFFIYTQDKCCFTLLLAHD